jgi:hypothetical protein
MLSFYVYTTMRQRVIISTEELRRRYQDEGQTLAVIAAELGCSTATISNLLRRHGITARAGRFPRRRIVIPHERLAQLYSVERRLIKDIAQLFGVSMGTINNRRKAYGIPQRPR